MYSTEDKLRRLFARHPEIKGLFKEPDFLEKYKKFSLLKGKNILVTEDPDSWRWFVLPNLLNDPSLTLREVDMGYALDVFTGNIEDEKSLYTISGDIMVIHDGRLKMCHSQKEIILARLWESAPIVLYEWRGDRESFNKKSQLDKSLKGEMLHEPGNKVSPRVSGTTPELF